MIDVVIKSNEQMSNIIAWCRSHLDDSEWEMGVLMIFPLEMKFYFKDKKTLTMALLNA